MMGGDGVERENCVCGGLILSWSALKGFDILADCFHVVALSA